MSDKPDRTIYEQAFSDTIPQNKALGLEVVEVAPRPRRAAAAVEAGAGRQSRDRRHGRRAITTMLDACCGMAVATMLKTPQPFATLDLRIDYVRPATKGEAVIAEAECYRITSNVAFTRAFAHHGDRQRSDRRRVRHLHAGDQGRGNTEPQTTARETGHEFCSIVAEVRVGRRRPAW